MNGVMATYAGGMLSDIEDMTGWSGMALTKIFEAMMVARNENVERSMVWAMLGLARHVNGLPGKAVRRPFYTYAEHVEAVVECSVLEATCSPLRQQGCEHSVLGQGRYDAF